MSRSEAAQKCHVVPRKRWTIVAAVTGSTMVLRLALLSNGPTLWRSETGLVPLAPRLVAACMWCAIYFGIDLLDDPRRAGRD